MRRQRRSAPFPIVLALIAALGGCTRTPRVEPAVPVAAEAAPAIPARWQGVATAVDRDRIARLAAAWSTGLAAAQAGRNGAAVSAEGALLDPAAARPRAMLPPGRYTCRVVKLGGRRGLAAFPPYFCFVEHDGALTTLVKETGAERPAGRLWADGEDRLIFLGGLALDKEPAAPAYGERADRDMAGVLERVDAFRWRLAMPFPDPQHALAVLELIPFLPPSRR